MILETTTALVQLFKTIEPNTHLLAGSIVELANLPAIVLTGPVLHEVLRRRNTKSIQRAVVPACQVDDDRCFVQFPYKLRKLNAVRLRHNNIQ